MKTFIVDRYGKKDGIRIGEMPDPEVRENDVLVQVHAAAVNLLDSKIRNGEFKFILPYRLPLILHNDVAGVVVRVGSQVRRFKAGDQVYARPPQDRIGSFAELISIVDRVFPFESTKEAMAYVEHGRAKGKVIVKVRQKSSCFGGVGGCDANPLLTP
jgi:NADPH:quinone reductase-like Zn-dependent oxidoreductase